ncbi:MAG: hypothetical protein HYS38_05890 [Acidobacteria bacterium]|nr:hypothetical protein [Acidobacteriota bacterium]
MLESTEHAAQQVAQTQGQPSNKGKFLWSGVALVAGGAALITLANTALRKDECTDIRSGCLVIGTECIEGTNAAAAWSGLGAGVLGVVLIIKGVSMSFQFGPNSFAYRVQF